MYCFLVYRWLTHIRGRCRMTIFLPARGIWFQSLLHLGWVAAAWVFVLIENHQGSMVPFLQGGSNLIVGYSKRTCKKKGRGNQREKKDNPKGFHGKTTETEQCYPSGKRDGHYLSSGFKDLRILHDGHVAPGSISQYQHKDNRETAWR